MKVVGRPFRAAIVAVALALSVAASAQTPAPVVRVTFAEAIRRAQEQNPTVAAAASGILRAEALIRQARAATLVQLTGNVTTTTLNRGVEFSGATVTPRNQITATATVDMPIVAAAEWARRAQAQDRHDIAELSVAETRRQVAFAAADAYLAILAARRVVESNTLARDTAKAHFDLATELEQRGTGSRLNALRAQQQYSVDDGLVETARLAVYRAQEALGVLIVADGPADATEEPDLRVPPDITASLTRFAGNAGTAAGQSLPLQEWRPDLRLFAGEQRAAERIARDSSKDWWPRVDAIFQPSSTYPAVFFLPQNSWRFLMQANIPMFDSGQRAAVKVQRQADVDQARATLAGAITSASSQVRTARETVASLERTLTTAQAAADQSHQVVNITNVSFRAGAATNIEVIDAERTARDSDTAVAIVEDELRRARLELLNALGRFP